jgi:hypothetical protein
MGFLATLVLRCPHDLSCKVPNAHFFLVTVLSHTQPPHLLLSHAGGKPERQGIRHVTVIFIEDDSAKEKTAHSQSI